MLRKSTIALLAILLLAAVFAVSAQSNLPAGVQAWEYKYVTYVVGQPVASTGGLGGAVSQAAATLDNAAAAAMAAVGATPTPANVNPSEAIKAELNAHGADGWELVSSDILPGGAAPAFVWIFKRPLP